jgi:hypothetical protein
MRALPLVAVLALLLAAPGFAAAHTRTHSGGSHHSSSSSNSDKKKVHMEGYTKKGGTHVAGYDRPAPHAGAMSGKSRAPRPRRRTPMARSFATPRPAASS